MGLVSSNIHVTHRIEDLIPPQEMPFRSICACQMLVLMEHHPDAELDLTVTLSNIYFTRQTRRTSSVRDSLSNPLYSDHSVGIRCAASS